MARRYKLRNGAIVEVAPGQETRHVVGVIIDGKIEYLLIPPHEENEIQPLPKGGILGMMYDAIAVDDPFNEGTGSRQLNDDLLDALRYAAGFATTTQGEIDLMSNQEAFTTIEYYHGSDVTLMSDDQIFGYVRNIDAKLKELGTLGDGKAVTAHTVRLETEKEGLLRVVDARYEAKTDASE